MTWAFLIIVAWVGYWGVWGPSWYNRAGPARLAFQMCILSGWIALMAVLALASR